MTWLNRISSLQRLFETSFKIKDSIVLSLFAGLIGTIIMDISNLFLWKTRKAETLYGHLAGSLLMAPFRTNQRKNFILGQILHMITGSVLAYPLTYIFKKTGKDHHLLKGALFGTVTWEAIYSLGQQIDLFKTKPHLTKSHYAALWHNILYGLVTAQVLVSSSDPSVFETTEDPSNPEFENPPLKTVWPQTAK